MDGEKWWSGQDTYVIKNMSPHLFQKSSSTLVPWSSPLMREGAKISKIMNSESLRKSWNIELYDMYFCSFWPRVVAESPNYFSRAFCARDRRLPLLCERRAQKVHFASCFWRSFTEMAYFSSTSTGRYLCNKVWTCYHSHVVPLVI